MVTVVLAMNNMKLPVGIDQFDKLIKSGFYYVDKTRLIEQLLQNWGEVNLFTRPRRFGKTLNMSMLRSFFEIGADASLFDGLYISRNQTLCREHMAGYPVIFITLKNVDGLSFEEAKCQFMDVIGSEASRFRFLLDSQNLAPEDKEQYQAIITMKSGAYWMSEPVLSRSLKTLSELLNKHYQKKALVLIDEYDAPLLDVVHERENLGVLRDVMRNFYSPLKACDPYLRYVFLTGITKFSQLSIFSELNNIKNISMDEPYAAICGITENEILTQMKEDVDRMAVKLNITAEEVLAKLKENYDGYHFTYPSPDIYNPFSLLNAFADGKFNSYWFGSGTPTYLIKMLDKFGVEPSEIGNKLAAVEEFDAPTETMSSITPLLYQSGYVTIKDYDKELELYTLDIPNKEVRVGLMRSLLPYYVTNDTREATNMVAFISRDIRKGDMDAALRRLQTFLSTIPQCDHTKYEGHYQQVFYIIFSLLGYYVDVEVRTSRGRVDVVLRTEATLYVMELKLDKNATVAMEQINLKNYPERFALCGLPVVKVAVNFDSESGTLGDWMIEK